ncbi:MAG TPA: hypothetical protein VMM35_06780 [Longimicrobiales bacterium]|nr:hypothetical protein [Longimicrobiales bacterium]
MNRRAFFRLTVRGKERILEISCERLYMRWIDARAGASGGGYPAEPAEAVWSGEPPLEVDVPTRARLMAELDARLANAHVLRVSGREWLAGDDFRQEVESRIEAFRGRGGRVE